MNKILVEGKYGHGAISVHPLIRNIKRWLRPQYHKHIKRVGSIAEIDWTQPYSSPHLGIKNQGTSDSCGGMAGSYFLEIQRLLQGINEGQLSAKSIYAPIAYPGGGTEPDDLETQLAVRGANLESEVPDGTTEQFMSDKSWQTQALIESAAKRAGYTPMSVNIDSDSIAVATKNEGGVILVVKGQNGNTPNWLSYTPQSPNPQNPNEVWEHFVCVFGYQLDGGIKNNTFLNSWGTDVGQNGIQTLDENYINNGIVDAFTLVKDTSIQPVKDNNSVWSWLWYYFMNKPLPLSP